MKSILISYDLTHASESHYADLIKYIKSYSSWAKPLESFWIVKTTSSAEDVRNAALKHLYAGDKLFAIDVTSDAAAWHNLPDDVSKWLRNNL